MNNPQTHLERIRERKTLINAEINSQIKAYQKKLVVLSFTPGNVSEEYNKILNKIKYLRKGYLNGKLRSF